MRKHKATIEQIEARQAKRAKMRELATKVASMSDVERLELSSRYPIATIDLAGQTAIDGEAITKAAAEVESDRAASDLLQGTLL